MRTRWTMMEPSLDELLEDEIMERVTRSDGLSVAEVRTQLLDLARRLAGGGTGACRSCGGAGA